MIFPAYEQQELTVKDRIKYIKTWLVENNWVKENDFSHPHIHTLLEKWEEWLSTPVNNNQQYEEFKKLFVNLWGIKWWDELLIYTFFLHPIYWLNKNNYLNPMRNAA